VEKQIILLLLPAGDLAIGSFPMNGVLRGMEQTKYSNQWNVKYNNLNKTKVMVFRGGGRH
jgi:hypothetical protein